MKNYGKVVPIVIVAVFVLSIYSLISERTDAASEYNYHLGKARELLDDGIYIDAFPHYKLSREMEPSIELDLEIAQAYIESDFISQANDWIKRTLLVEYPRDVRIYEFVIQSYIEQDNLRYAFATYDTYQKYGLYSEIVEKDMDAIRYLYKIADKYKNVGPYSNASYLVGVQLEDAWGYANQEGSIVVPNTYAKADLFVGGLAAVVDQDGNAYCIDESGHTKIISSYFKNRDGEDSAITELKTPQSGMILAYDGTTWQFYKQDTYELMYDKYEQATSFIYNVAAVQKSGEKWKLIDINGNDLTAPVFEEILISEKGIAYMSQAIIAKKNQTSGYQLYDVSGVPITDTVYENAKTFLDFTFAPVQKSDGKWIFVDGKGIEQSFGPFEDANSFSNGFAAVKKDGLWGFINLEGEMVIENVFYDVKFFSNRGTCFVKTEPEEAAEWRELQFYSEIY